MNESDLSDLMSVSYAEKPHLSDVIHFPTDISPHPLICLWAGVGAGKNTFVEKMITGCPEENIPRLTVLLITSRKAKVLETLSKEAISATDIIDDDRTIEEILLNTSFHTNDFKHIVEDASGWEYHIHQRSVICTNAFIEAYLKYRYLPSDPSTHLWNRFDVIVWDEAHALHTDSSYQSAPFHVMQLIRETYRRMKLAGKDPLAISPTCKHLIFMSGTPESIENIPNLKKSQVLDLRQVCINIVPKNIHFIDASQASKQIRFHLEQGERIIYFMNHTSLPDTLSEKFEISSKKIAVSFSKEEKRKAFKDQFKNEDSTDNKPENDYTRMVAVEKYLSQHSRIRPDIALFATTSRNKEGINIEDTDIHHVYIESHSMTDIKQMMGRLRNGADHAYIILDSVGHANCEHRFEQEFAQQFTLTLDKNTLSQANADLLQFCQHHHICDLALNSKATKRAYDEEVPYIGQYIDLIKSKSPYIEYDYISNKFCFNSHRKNSLAFLHRELEKFDDAAENPDRLVELFRIEFPESHIHPYISSEAEAQEYVRNFLNQNPADYYPAETLQALIVHLEELLGRPKRRKQGTPSGFNYYLRKIGYQCSRRNHNPKHEYYNFYKIEILPSDNADNSEAA